MSFRKKVEITTTNAHLLCYDERGEPIDLRKNDFFNNLQKMVIKTEKSPGFVIEIIGFRKCPNYLYPRDVWVKIKIFG